MGVIQIIKVKQAKGNIQKFKVFILALIIITFLFITHFFKVAREAQTIELKEPISHGTVVYASDGRILTTFLMKKKKYIDIVHIPKNVQYAVISIEDQRFYKHDGFDFRSITRAFLKNIKSLRIIQGGSTITQQFVKSTYLNDEKSVSRKIKEIILARKCEKKYSKEKILELYLNNIYFGEGAYGLEDASKTYFGHEAKDLNLAEAALLACTLKAPNDFSFLRNPKAAQERSSVVLQKMRELGYINKKDEIKARRNIFTMLKPIISYRHKDKSIIDKDPNRIIPIYFPIKEGYFYSYTNNWHEDVGNTSLSEHQSSNSRKANDGIDISAPPWAPIVAANSGTIEGINSKSVKDYGNHLYIKDNQGKKYFYAYLSSFASGVINGANITRGQEIGFIGKKNPSDIGPTLHFEIHSPYLCKRCDPSKKVSAINPYNSLQAADKQRYKYSLYIEYIKSEIIKRYGEKAVYFKGLSISTTFEPEIQKKAEEVIDKLNKKNSSTDNILMVIHPKTGYLLALAGDREISLSSINSSKMMIKGIVNKNIYNFQDSSLDIFQYADSNIKLPELPKDWKIERIFKSGQKNIYVVIGQTDNKKYKRSINKFSFSKSSLNNYSYTFPAAILKIKDKDSKILEKKVDFSSETYPPRKVKDNELYVVIDLSSNLEYILEGNPEKRTINRVLEIHPIASGMKNSGFWFETPEGKWIIYNKKKSFGEYGPRFLPLYKWNEKRFVKVGGYGLHGTDDESSINQHISHGCVRHFNDTIKHLYKILPEGTIVYTVKGSNFKKPDYNNDFKTNKVSKDNVKFDNQISFNPDAKITFCFDDGFQSAYKLASPILIRKKIPGVIYTTTDILERNEKWAINWEQLLKLQDSYHWEIGSHGRHHIRLDRLSEEEIERELLISKEIMNSKGLVVNSFSSPYGGYNEQVLELIAKFYQSHRIIGGYNNKFPYNDYKVTCKTVSRSVSVTEVKKWVDEAVSNQEWLILLFHNIVDKSPNEFEYNTKDLQNIVDYIEAMPIKPVTVSQGLDIYKKNLINNSSFEKTIKNNLPGWTINKSNNIKIDFCQNGNYPKPGKSLSIKEFGEGNSITSSLININPKKTYLLKMFQKVNNYKYGSVSFHINEYNSSGKLIQNRCIGEICDNFIGVKSIIYMPSSPDTKIVELQIRTQGLLNLYTDSIILAPLNN